MILSFLKKGETVSRPIGYEGLIWSIPNSDIPKIGDVKEIVVRDIERVVFYKDGEIQDVVSPGRHSVSGIDEIVWVDTSEFRQLFGVQRRLGLTTSDKVRVGFHGYITLSVGIGDNQIRSFLFGIPWRQQVFTRKDLVGFLKMGPIPAIFRDILKDLSFEQFENLEREGLVRIVTSKLSNELDRYGINLVSIDILEWVNG